MAAAIGYGQQARQGNLARSLWPQRERLVLELGTAKLANTNENGFTQGYG
jgi:hypothetical protein